MSSFLWVRCPEAATWQRVKEMAKRHPHKWDMGADGTLIAVLFTAVEVLPLCYIEVRNYVCLLHFPALPLRYTGISPAKLSVNIREFKEMLLEYIFIIFEWIFFFLLIRFIFFLKMFCMKKCYLYVLTLSFVEAFGKWVRNKKDSREWEMQYYSKFLEGKPSNTKVSDDH